MSHPEFEYLGPYRVEQTLGRGGMGTVYKGLQVKSGVPVAIKVIAPEVANQSRFRRRFESEVQTLKMLKHPNIVTLEGHGEEQGLLFYSMEYVDGRSLHEHLRIYNRMPWEDVVEVGIQTTSALKHAHDIGIIHRDIKPANLMLNKSGNIKLTDFGIAKLFGSADMTAVGAVIGTADYMPPEQAEGKGVTMRSDLYGLGGVLYALLTGRAPFSGKSVPEVLYAVRYNPIPNLEDRVPDAPKELCELIHELLAKDPGARPPTALVVGNRLKALKRGTQAQGTAISSGNTKADGPQKKVGAKLTSLDLSDADVPKPAKSKAPKTEGQDQKAGDHANLPSMETRRGGVGTHEQRTMLAPENFAAQNRAKAPTSIAHESESKASEFSHPGLRESESQIGPLSSGGPSHYTPVTSGDSEPFVLSGGLHTEDPTSAWIQYLSAGGIVCTLIAAIAFGWWMLQPRPANEIYREIIAAVESGDDSQLLASSGEIEAFLNRFPEDERAVELQAFADEIELTRSTRVLQRRASRSGGTNELTAVEQGFLDCMQARSENFEQAQEKLSAFIAIYSPLENLERGEKRLVELAQFAQAMGTRPERKIPVAVNQLAVLIQSAEKQLSGKGLESYYRHLLTLYGDKPWAGPQMNRIKQRLAGSESTTTQEEPSELEN